MKFGVTLPNNWGLERAQDVIDMATRAEEAEFHSVWVSHHVLHVGFVLERLGNRPYYDPMTVLTYVAAVTTKVRLGTSVLVLPYLNPIVLAKALATLDVLSGGRLTLGLGVGALRPESDALGATFTRRGAYTEEGIKIMKTLWTHEAPSFDGRFYRFSGVKFSPKPLQKPHPPIWIGGNSDAALRRAARLAQGWHPSGLSPAELASRVDYLRAEAEAVGRALSDITLSVRLELDVLPSPEAEQKGPMIGTPDQLLRSIEAYANIGVQEMVLSVNTDDMERVHRVMETFASRVMRRAK